MATKRKPTPAAPGLDSTLAATLTEAEALTLRAAEGRRAAEKLAGTIRTVSRLVSAEDPGLGLEFSELAHELRDELMQDAARDDPTWEIRALLVRYNDLVQAFRRSRESRRIEDPRGAAQEALSRLGGADAAATSQILGIDPRTLRNWRRQLPGRFKDPERLLTVAAVLVELASPGPEARVRWFMRPREALSGKRPLDLVEGDAAAARDPLIALARGSRGQLAA